MKQIISSAQADSLCRGNGIKTDWNNEETYHHIVRRRFAAQ